MIRVAIDAMGGDLGPCIAFECANNLLSKYSDIEIQLYYHESSSCKNNSTNLYLSKFTKDASSRLILVNCLDYYRVDEELERSLFKRKDASLYQALLSMKQGRSDVVVTCGNTGVMVALARYLLGLIRPKLYPALMRELSVKPLRCLVDLGANVHCPASMLCGFAELGSAYVEEMGKEKAKVGLLNVGVEASKGSNIVKQVDNLLSKREWPNYLGYAEGHELFTGDKNVIVCDGMVGNAVLKASEGLLHFLMGKTAQLKDSNQVLESFYQSERRHGACLVGVRGNLVKSHGDSDVPAMIGAVEYGIDIARTQLSKKIEARLTREEIE
ncbi:fatty acid synthesis protein [Marinomonas sp. S3726]|uniref:fatty acid synthesis protein n=1 Tax=Marinomonas sp. S3726 TaxID=579484 RepID=UPI0005FA057E|nr:fatty acid synthesis protein [Marinomonas sp. S3726]KJZ07884.1 fatty acid synthesis protein [Marinomonas sp. S3726]